MRPPVRIALIHLAGVDRNVELPLDAADQLVAWMNDPHGTLTFELPPVDVDGEMLVLRIHRDEVTM